MIDIIKGWLESMITDRCVSILPQIKWLSFEGNAVIFDLELNRYLEVPPEVIDVLETLKLNHGDLKQTLSCYPDYEEEVNSYFEYLLENVWLMPSISATIKPIEHTELSDLDKYHVEQLIFDSQNELMLGDIDKISTLFRQNFACKSVCIDNINSKKNLEYVKCCLSLFQKQNFHFIAISGRLDAINTLVSKLTKDEIKNLTLEVDAHQEKEAKSHNLLSLLSIIDSSVCSDFFKRCDWSTYSYLRKFKPASRFIRINDNQVFAGKHKNNTIKLGIYKEINEINKILYNRVNSPHLKKQGFECEYGAFCMGH